MLFKVAPKLFLHTQTWSVRLRLHPQRPVILVHRYRLRVARAAATQMGEKMVVAATLSATQVCILNLTAWQWATHRRNSECD